MLVSWTSWNNVSFSSKNRHPWSAATIWRIIFTKSMNSGNFSSTSSGSHCPLPRSSSQALQWRCTSVWEREISPDASSLMHIDITHALLIPYLPPSPSPQSLTTNPSAYPYHPNYLPTYLPSTYPPTYRPIPTYLPTHLPSNRPSDIHIDTQHTPTIYTYEMHLHFSFGLTWRWIWNFSADNGLEVVVVWVISSFGTPSV